MGGEIWLVRAAHNAALPLGPSGAPCPLHATPTITAVGEEPSFYRSPKGCAMRLGDVGSLHCTTVARASSGGWSHMPLASHQMDRFSLLAWQILGTSKSGTHAGWKLFHLELINDWHGAAEGFPDNRPYYTPDNVGLVEVICQMEL